MKAGKVLKRIGSVILWIFVVFAALLTIVSISASRSKSGAPELFGKMMVTVLSQSMEPEIMTGDLILSDSLVGADDKETLAVGDVITFFTDLDKNGIEELNTHRIIEVFEDNGYTYFRTPVSYTHLDVYKRQAQKT